MEATPGRTRTGCPPHLSIASRRMSTATDCTLWENRRRRLPFNPVDEHGAANLPACPMWWSATPWSTLRRDASEPPPMAAASTRSNCPTRRPRGRGPRSNPQPRGTGCNLCRRPCCRCSTWAPNRSSNSTSNTVTSVAHRLTRPGMGGLVPGDSLQLELAPIATPNGWSQFTAILTGVNGVVDERTANNTRSVEVHHIEEDVPLVVSFESDCFASQHGWVLRDALGRVLHRSGWVSPQSTHPLRSTRASRSRCTGTSSAATNPHGGLRLSAVLLLSVPGTPEPFLTLTGHGGRRSLHLVHEQPRWRGMHRQPCGQLRPGRPV